MAVDRHLGGIDPKAGDTLKQLGDWLRNQLPEGFRFVLFASKLDGSDAAYTSNLDRASAVDAMRELWDIIIATAPQSAQEREARELLLTLRALFKKDAELIKKLADGEIGPKTVDPQMIQATAQFFAIQHALTAKADRPPASPTA